VNSRRRVQALYDELRLAHEELQSLQSRAREMAVTEERNRLAREIHDSLAHYLTVVNLQLEAAEKLVGGRPADALQQVKKARRLTLESLQEVRRSVAALRAQTYEALSLPRSLAELTAEFAEATGLDVCSEVHLPEDEAIPVEIALACYRTAQEALTNLQRHARATSARVTLDKTGQVLRLAVSDDGVGPTAPNPSSDGGFGLQGLRERVALLGGELHFGPNQPRGSVLTVTIPLDGRAP
jgi:signal transduction histidine kinase